MPNMRIPPEQVDAVLAAFKAAGLEKLFQELQNETRRLATAQHAELLECARDNYEIGSNDDIEIDDDADISEADAGTWVQGWLWVNHEELEKFRRQKAEKQKQSTTGNSNGTINQPVSDPA